METRQRKFSSGLNQSEIDIWFSVDYVPEIGRYLIYFKLTPPNNFFYGEIIRDEHGQRCTFETSEEAFSYGNRYVLGRLIHEE